MFKSLINRIFKPKSTNPKKEIDLEPSPRIEALKFQAALHDEITNQHAVRAQAWEDSKVEVN